MLPPLGCLYGGLSMAFTTGNFWTKAKLSRPSTTLPNCKSWTVLAHPSYSPDLVPTDYHLLPDMQQSFEGTDFKTKSEVENWLVSYFASKKPQFWRTGATSLQNRWQTVADKEGKYY
uniref:Histone-lysine N-methyltransferase SETMAR n=1 Tax=Caenorhabditis japonica TaxID=281687 RepID=A0A8R1E3C9_CAEJA